MNERIYTKKDIEHCLGLYNKSDDCVFPYLCTCEDCLEMWGAKHLSFAVDNEIMRKILKEHKGE